MLGWRQWLWQEQSCWLGWLERSTSPGPFFLTMPRRCPLDDVCFRAFCLSAQALITDQVLLFVEIYQTRASLPQKLLQKLMNPEMYSEIEKRNLFSHERRSTSSKMAKITEIYFLK